MTIKGDVENSQQEADICFHNINMTNALIAFAAVESGCKIAIVLPPEINWKYQPSITQFYPPGLFQLAGSLSNFFYLKKISRLFPNLIYPVRIYNFSTLSTFHFRFLLFADVLLGRGREKATLPINASKYPSLKQIKNFKKGALAFEYRVDRNMIIYELLEYCKKKGALILKDNQNINSKVSAKLNIFSQPFQFGLNAVRIFNSRLGFGNDIRITTSAIDMQSQYHLNDTLLHFIVTRKVNKKEFFKHCRVIIESIGLEMNEEVEAQLLNIYNCNKLINTTFSKRDRFVYDPEIKHFKNYYRNIEFQISLLMGKNIRLEKGLRKLKGNSISTENFLQLQAECEEKYDLAKQSGISFDKFQYYFFRYRKNIDVFTEKAYLKLKMNKNPETIWSETEREFQETVKNGITFTV